MAFKLFIFISFKDCCKTIKILKKRENPEI